MTHGSKANHYSEADIVALLRTSSSFSHIGDKRLHEIAERSEIETAEAGLTLFQQGDEGNFAFLVLDGELAVEVETESGRVRVAVVHRGQIVGEIAAFTATPRTATVSATTSTHLLRIKRSTIRRLLEREPDAAMSIIAQLGQRLQNLNGIIATLTQATLALGRGDFEPSMLTNLRNQADRFAHFAETFEQMALEMTDKRGRQQEMRTAADIQGSFLPRPLAPGGAADRVDVAATMIPAKEIGGDFYDYFLIDSTRIAFAIGDVSGKGVPASMFMSVSRTVLKTVGREAATTADAIAKANTLLAEDNSQSMFVTIAYAVLDVDSGELEVTCGGHEEAYLVTRAGLQKIPRSGPAIGLFGGVPFTSTRYQLAPGDMLVLATDGITEAFAPDRSMFGTERFEQELAAMAELKAKDVSDRLVSAVQRFAATAPQSDDISCVVVRYLG